MEDTKYQLERCNQRLEKLEQWKRQREAAQYVRMSQLERAIDGVLDTAIIVLGGGMVVLAAFMVMVLR